jgi:hypothetical protein
VVGRRLLRQIGFPAFVESLWDHMLNGAYRAVVRKLTAYD